MSRLPIAFTPQAQLASRLTGCEHVNGVTAMYTSGNNCIHYSVTSNRRQPYIANVFIDEMILKEAT